MVLVGYGYYWLPWLHEGMLLMKLDLTSDHLERSNQGHVNFNSLQLGNGAC